MSAKVEPGDRLNKLAAKKQAVQDRIAKGNEELKEIQGQIKDALKEMNVLNGNGTNKGRGSEHYGKVKEMVTEFLRDKEEPQSARQIANALKLSYASVYGHLKGSTSFTQTNKLWSLRKRSEEPEVQAAVAA